MNDIPSIKRSESYHSVVDTKKKPTRRQVLNRFETAPQEGWQLIKKWVGRRQASNNRLVIGNIERQAEMNTITPLIMAMFFSKDEHDKNRIPVFLTNITCKIILADEEEGYKGKLFGGTVFKISLEYGSGPSKVTWAVYRTYWDFVKLHYRYSHSSHLPSFPSLPHWRAKARQESNINDLEGSVSSSLVSSSHMVQVAQPDPIVLGALENYLNELVNSIEPCGYVNRICRFLELSALGLELAAKYPGRHGKEGSAVLQSRTDKEPKQKRNLFKKYACLNKRNNLKWLIVRESYLVCVDDPSETRVYDVFLFDQSFEVHRLNLFGDKSKHRVKDNPKKFRNTIANASHWAAGRSVVCIKNTQGVYHFRTKNERHARQFELSIKTMAQESLWCNQQRFGSFAPICPRSAVTWFVDGRDYFWDLSVALENAKETIYIHDWWLFLRRPHTKNPEWRLDRVLRRKAEEGIKIYIVMYKEVAMALPLYSHLAKRHLLSLSPNIYVQRHPSRALDVFDKDSIFFWAHHEKICVIDNQIAFMGGIDQCFGRYDTPSHALTDPGSNIWPGKDYSNPRIIDFHTLDQPFEDNMDRSRLPRMPWHDISMRIVGKAACHVARHFVQRWNFLRRKKASKRPTPLLVPGDTHGWLDDDDRILHPHTSRNCRVQILRSVSPWSIGSMERIEYSILNAYIELIRESEHFIYIENQFFVTSTKVGSTVIENGIGNAIVDRILRAKKEKKRWRAIVVIPLVPGFPANIDETEATTVRLIMQCQYLSIGRGPDSILGRLHAAGIRTHEYINFYGLRNWAELNGQYVTEQVYIHAKTMIVDDRRVITGSANINERSQLGTRDSEIAACIEDEDWLDSTLNGENVRVGKYAHSLRMRLMAEHIGLDVDQMDKEKYSKQDDNRGDGCLPPFVQIPPDQEEGEEEEEKEEVIPQTLEENDDHLQKRTSSTKESQNLIKNTKRKSLNYLDFWSTLDCDTNTNNDPKNSLPEYYTGSPSNFKKRDELSLYEILKDPVGDSFQKFWHTLARSNTDLFRRSFLVMPDNNVKNWDEYHHFIKMAKVFLGRTDTKHGGTSAASASVQGKVVDLLKQIKGHLVIWPNYFMEQEDENNEFIFQIDKIPPIEIFD
ncbi:hypothetical protein G6F56_003493 [Rhizopus delemar]|nr:hypothetical protein G6F56_003493 [Rhizopus delemar]